MGTDVKVGEYVKKVSNTLQEFQLKYTLMEQRERERERVKERDSESLTEWEKLRETEK